MNNQTTRKKKGGFFWFIIIVAVILGIITIAEEVITLSKTIMITLPLTKFSQRTT